MSRPSNLSALGRQRPAPFVSTATAPAGSGHRGERSAGLVAAQRAVRGLIGIGLAQRIRIVATADRAPTAVAVRPSVPIPAISLSIAHAGGLAVAAAVTGARVGVDLEPIGVLPIAHQRFFLTQRERRDTDLPTLVWWLLKEAAWKALGLTVAAPFTSLELIMRQGGLVALAHDGGRCAASATVHEPGPGYLMAVVVVPELA